ncbi:MAG TPA: DUF1367 family protein [Burkholderiaceae bacterium]|nr:DUF1367 family protein [Burkholderiaceae bacterium]
MLAHMIKMPGNVWRPANDESAEEMDKFKLGSVATFECKRTRNYKFLKKFFAMLNLGFDAWEPPKVEYRGQVAVKNRERFRKDCLVMAGFFDVVVNLRGETRVEAKSISFGSMEEAEFEKVYSAVADVLLQRVLTTYTRADLDKVVDQMLAFT